MRVSLYIGYTTSRIPGYVGLAGHMGKRVEIPCYSCVGVWQGSRHLKYFLTPGMSGMVPQGISGHIGFVGHGPLRNTLMSGYPTLQIPLSYPDDRVAYQ